MLTTPINIYLYVANHAYTNPHKGLLPKKHPTNNSISWYRKHIKAQNTGYNHSLMHTMREVLKNMQSAQHQDSIQICLKSKNDYWKKNMRKNCIYNILYSCSRVYQGKIGQYLKIRFEEHQKTVMYEEINSLLEPLFRKNQVTNLWFHWHGQQIGVHTVHQVMWSRQSQEYTDASIRCDMYDRGYIYSPKTRFNTYRSYRHLRKAERYKAEKLLKKQIMKMMKLLWTNHKQ